LWYRRPLLFSPKTDVWHSATFVGAALLSPFFPLFLWALRKTSAGIFFFLDRSLSPLFLFFPLQACPPPRRVFIILSWCPPFFFFPFPVGGVNGGVHYLFFFFFFFYTPPPFLAGDLFFFPFHPKRSSSTGFGNSLLLFFISAVIMPGNSSFNKAKDVSTSFLFSSGKAKPFPASLPSIFFFLPH